MLTTAQQKVKQELDELQLNALTHQHNKPMPPHKRHSFKNRIITITAISLLMLTCSLLLKGYWTDKELGVPSYLTKVHDYNKQSETLLNDFLTGKMENLDDSRAKQEDFLAKVTNLKTSTSFHDYQQDLITVIEHRLNMMTSFKNPTDSDQNQLNQSLIELSVKRELALDSLIKGFEREKITYKLKENGTVQYWINSKSYSVSK